MEIRITLNNGIVGIISKPDMSDTTCPAVLMLHGFATQKNEVGDIFKNLAKELLNKNIVSFRIDFQGWGESNIERQRFSTIGGMIEDALSAYNYLSELSYVDKKRIGICGCSLGAGIAILTSERQLNAYKSMVAISPARDLRQDFLTFLGEKIFLKAEQSEQTNEIDLGWTKVKLEKEFFRDLNKHDTKDAIKKFKGAFFSIAGSKDFSAENAQTYVNLLPSEINKKVLIIPDADHIFDVFTDKNSTPKVIDETASWLSSTL